MCITLHPKQCLFLQDIHAAIVKILLAQERSVSHEQHKIVLGGEGVCTRCDGVNFRKNAIFCYS